MTMSLLGTVPGQAVLPTVSRLGMGECCLNRTENTPGCVLKSNCLHKRMADFGSVSCPCLVYCTLSMAQEGERIRKYPGVQQNTIVAEKSRGGRSLIAHVVTPSPCSNNHTGKSEAQKT